VSEVRFHGFEGPCTRALGVENHRHAGIGYVTSDDEHAGLGESARQGRRDGLDGAASTGLPTTARRVELNPPRGPEMMSNRDWSGVAG